MIKKRSGRTNINMSNKYTKAFFKLIVLINIFSLIISTFYFIANIPNKVFNVNNTDNIDFAPIQKLKINNKLITENSGEIKVNAESELKKYGDFIPGQVLVKFKELAGKKSFVEQNTGESDQTGKNKTVLLELSKVGNQETQKKDTVEVIDLLKYDTRVEYSEPNIIYKSTFIPNDKEYSSQWHLNNIYNSEPAKGISAEGAWNATKGNSPIIAIMDTGFDVYHPDLTQNILKDSVGSIIGKNFGDDCFYTNPNGTENLNCNHKYVSDSLGNPNYSYFHGTEVAGAAAATGNNSIGISGSCPNCKIMPLGLFGSNPDDQGNSFYKIYDAFDFAIKNNASIINMSFGGPYESLFFKDKIKQAHEAGIIMIASAGNCGDNNFELNGCNYINQPSFPASFENVISVAASDPNGTKASFSNHNVSTDLTAPGVDIFTTSHDYNCLIFRDEICYNRVNGTSFSAPIVAGIAGLIISQHPSWSPDQVKAKLNSSVDDIYTLNPSLTGSLGTGLANACIAVDACDLNGSLLSISYISNTNVSISSKSILTPAKFSFGTLNSNNSILRGMVDDNFPKIKLDNCIIPDFAFVYVTDKINTLSYDTRGKIINCEFVPYFNTKIPLDWINNKVLFLKTYEIPNLELQLATNFLPNPNTSSATSSVQSIKSYSSTNSSSLTVTSSTISSSMITNSSATDVSKIYTFGDYNGIPLQGTVENAFPVITFSNCDIPNNTQVELNGELYSSTIQGTMQSCVFVPKLGSIIPEFYNSPASDFVFLFTKDVESFGAVIPTKFANKVLQITSPINNIQNSGGTITIIPIKDLVLNSSSVTRSGQNSNTSIKPPQPTTIIDKKTSFKLLNIADTPNSLQFNNQVGIKFEGADSCFEPTELSLNKKEKYKIDSNPEFEFGLIDFKIKCDTEVKVKIYYYGVQNWDNWEVKKIIKNDSNKFEAKGFEVSKSYEETEDKNVAIISYILSDGGLGDDSPKDGYIIDPIGISKKPQSPLKQEISRVKDKILDNLNLVRTGGSQNMYFNSILILVILSLIGLSTTTNLFISEQKLTNDYRAKF